MNIEERSFLTITLLDAVREMFAVDMKRCHVIPDASATDLGGTLVASIGFSGHGGLQGALVLIADPSFFLSVYPQYLPQSRVSRTDLADWAGELANQLLGRMKNRLCTKGLHFSLSVPVVVHGEQLRPQPREHLHCIDSSLVIGGERVTLRFEMRREPGAQPVFVGAMEAAPAVAEGSVLLF